jgi:hypothetical protein
MRRTFLFVHGTGVRGSAYARSLQLVQERLTKRDPSAQVVGCFWGEAEGASLALNGASIPSYADSGGEELSEAEEALALWDVLYTDPWYELRLIRHRSAGSLMVPGQLPPSQALTQQVQSFSPSSQLKSELDRLHLAQEFDQALSLLAWSAEFAEAVKTALADPLEHRRIIARALLARTVVLATSAGEPVLDGEARDALLQQLTDELGGYGLGVVSWLVRPFKGLAARAVTRRMQRARGSITDAAAPAAGDILRYQARGDGVRRFIRQAIDQAAGDQVTVIGHSLGGVACVDLFAEAAHVRVDRLVTVGSQAPFLYEIGALVSLKPGAQLPDHFPAWVNVYDRRDILAYVAEAVFPGRVTDVAVDNRQPFPQAHSAYWANRAVWDAVCSPAPPVRQ